MKKIIFILGLAAVVLGTSCSDVLDLNPADRFSPATVWSTTTTADKYVIGLYSIFGANTEMRGGDAYASPRLSDAYSDILKSTLCPHPPRKRIPARRGRIRPQIR